MEFQSCMSAMKMEVRTSTATHSLDGISEQHVSNGNGGQNINSNSQPGWNFRAACQQWKWRSEHQQQLTAWMEFQSSMSAMEMEVRTSTSTHSLDGISEQHVSNGNGGQNINSNSHPGWNFRAANVSNGNGGLNINDNSHSGCKFSHSFPLYPNKILTSSPFQVPQSVHYQIHSASYSHT